MKIAKRNVIMLFLLLSVLIFSAFFPLTGAKALADGESTSEDFEYSETEETLYQYKDLTSLTVIRFYEFGYGSENAEDFELSFYIYNPNKIEFQESDKNKVQIGFASRDKDVFRTSYSKYKIEKIGQSETGLFVGYKVVGFPVKTQATRYYCVSGVELHKPGNTNATEYGVGVIYKCTTKDNKTTISTDTLPTCEVDVTHTYWRSGYSDKGEGWSNQVSSCYFSLPEAYSGEKSSYGRLEALTAEFWNYFTTPMYVTNNIDNYNHYKSLIGKTCTPSIWVNRWVETDDVFNSLTFADVAIGNVGEIDGANYTSEPYVAENLYWVFYDGTENIDFSSKEYCFDGANIAEEYGNAVGKTVVTNNLIGTLFETEEYYNSADLSLCGFKFGYNKHTYSIDDKPNDEDDVLGFDLKVPGETSWIERLFHVANGESESLLPLVQVQPEDLWLSNLDFSKKYYVNVNDVVGLKNCLSDANEKNRDVWVLRYDVCEYYGDDVAGRDAIIARESVYLDFDILSFRFDQNGAEYTIAANMSSQDVWNDITPGTPDEPQYPEDPKNEPGFWDRLVAFLKKIAGWAITIIGGAVAIALLALTIRFSISLWQKNIHWIWKMLLTLLLIGFWVIIYVFAVPWVIDLIEKLGGLYIGGK